MRTLVFFVIATLMVAAFPGCANTEKRISIEEEYNKSYMVFTGTVVSCFDRVTPSRDSSYDVQGTFYMIQVNQVFKGVKLRQLQLFSENSSVRFPMNIGDSYLIFATKEIIGKSNYPRYVINNLGNSMKLEDANTTLEELQKLKNRPPNKALVPTPMSVTPAAGAPVAPATGAAHL